MVQPHLHDHITCVKAPGIWLSPASGQLTGGADGLYVADRRALSRLVVALDGVAPVPVSAVLRGPSTARFLGVVAGLGGPALGRAGIAGLGGAADVPGAGTGGAAAGSGEAASGGGTGGGAPGPAPADPVSGQPGFEENAVTVERIRTVTAHGGEEQILVHNRGRTQVTTVLTVAVGTDLAPVSTVKTGRRGSGPDPEPVVVPAGEEGTGSAGGPAPERRTWSAPDGFGVEVRGTLRAELRLAPGQTYATTLTVTATPPATTGFRPMPGTAPASWAAAPLTVRGPDPRVGALVAQGVADIGALLLGDGDDTYAGAGSPWYLTLFGRDSLWTARMSFPLGYELAAGTLRALARRQGTRHDEETEEEPGKIPHELRPTDAATWLPPVYYGSVDATPLFVVTLAEARRWGMPYEQVAELLPAAESALGWLGSFDGFVSYRGTPGKLVNQGWKDSADGVQHADGRLGRPPLALCEVQGYAYQAAVLGAELLEAYGRPGAQRWRDWAADLAARFRDRFWLDGDPPYPAVAVDGDGRPVDGPASNMGHLLGTGLLTAAEEARVAERLGELDSGWGLRTLTGRAAGFNPLSYHAGSVWPHDTAIVILGLVRAGFGDLARRLAGGLVAAAPYFSYRLPELYGGYTTDPPVPYPAACRPQAWSSAASTVLVTALLGLEADVPAGSVRLRPLPGTRDLTVDNLRVGDGVLAVRVGRDGEIEVTRRPDGLTVTAEPPGTAS